MIENEHATESGDEPREGNQPGGGGRGGALDQYETQTRDAGGARSGELRHEDATRNEESSIPPPRDTNTTERNR